MAATKVEGELHGEVGEGDDAEPEGEQEGLQETPGPAEDCWLVVVTKVVLQPAPGLPPPPSLLPLPPLLLPPQPLLHQVEVVLLRPVALPAVQYRILLSGRISNFGTVYPSLSGPKMCFSPK